MADFWKAEEKWQEEELAAGFVVDITDHRTEGTRFKSWVTYNVVSPLSTAGVRRRYSDFEWLRELLKLRFHGMAIPMLPEKKLIGNQGPEFIEERKRGLISFMNVLTDNPYLRHDHTVRSFLTVAESGAGEWDQAKRAADSGEGAHPSVNMGLNRWFGVLRNYPIPTDADDACATFLLHCNEMEKTARTLLASLNKYFECAVKLSAALNDVHTAMEGFETTAMMGTSSLPSSLADAGEFVGAAASMTNKVGTALGSLKDLSGFAPSEIQVFLVDAIEKEISRVTSVKQLIAMREDALKQYQSAWGKQDKLEYEVKQWTAKGRRDRAEKLEPQVAQAATAVKHSRERLDDITKGLMHVEARKLSRTRLEKLTSIFGQYAALGIASGAKTQELWTTLLGALELDEASMVTAAQSTLSGTSADDATPVHVLVAPVANAAVGAAVTAPAAPAAPSFAGAGAGAGDASLPPGADEIEVDL